MNTELALDSDTAVFPSFAVTVGAPLCELMRRYSDATAETSPAFERSTDFRWEFDELGGEPGSFRRTGADHYIDLQLAVA